MLPTIVLSPPLLLPSFLPFLTNKDSMAPYQTGPNAALCKGSFRPKYSDKNISIIIIHSKLYRYI